LDFEVLSDLRQQAESERDRLMSNGRLGGSASLGGFFQQKFDELKGVNQEQAKAEKIKAVEGKIDAVSGNRGGKFFVPLGSRPSIPHLH